MLSSNHLLKCLSKIQILLVFQSSNYSAFFAVYWTPVYVTWWAPPSHQLNLSLFWDLEKNRTRRKFSQLYWTKVESLVAKDSEVHNLLFLFWQICPVLYSPGDFNKRHELSPFSFTSRWEMWTKEVIKCPFNSATHGSKNRNPKLRFHKGN